MSCLLHLYRTTNGTILFYNYFIELNPVNNTEITEIILFKQIFSAHFKKVSKGHYVTFFSNTEEQ